MKQKKRRNFLFITFSYPPIHSIASMRSWKLAKYIRDFGWEPIVLASGSGSQTWASPLPDVRVDRIENELFLQGITRNAKESLLRNQASHSSEFVTPRISFVRGMCYKAARLGKRALGEALAYPDDYADWRKKALVCGREVLSREKVDLILSTANPFSSHIAASTLSKESGIPWVADYRDLWTQSHFARHTKIRLFFERRLEASVLKTASAAVTVSEPLACALQAIFQRPVYTITNGFDPEDYSVPVETDPVFSLAYTGTIYEKRQSLSALFKAISLLLESNQVEKHKFRLHFYGSDKRYLTELLDGKGIDEMIQIHDTVPFEESVQRQKAATALLFLNWNDLRQKGLYSGKIFEYLGAGRPILAFPRNPDSVVDRLLERTQAGVLCDTPEEIAHVLKEWYDAYNAVGSLSYNGVDAEIEKYSRRNQARQFAEIFNQLML